MALKDHKAKNTDSNSVPLDRKDSPNRETGALKSYQAFVSIVCLLVAAICWHFLCKHHYCDKTDKFQSYYDACISGEFTSLKDLHKYVKQDIPTHYGEMSRDEFINSYYWKAKPVLMKGSAKNWKSLNLWSDDYLVRNFYDTKFYVDMKKHHFTGQSVRTKMNLGRFLNSYKTKEWYLDSMTTDHRFLDMMDVPKYLNISGIFTPNAEGAADFFHNLYLSSGDTDSPLHFDGYSNLLTVLDGTKEWILAEPSEAAKIRMDDWVDYPNLSPMNVTDFSIADFPQLCNVTWYRAVLHPGDTLFVPDLHPHHVYSPPGRNLAVGMWFNVQEYNEQLFEMGFHDEGENGRFLPIAKQIEIFLEHVKTRAHPCELTSCVPLAGGKSTLRTLLYDNEEQYSRDSDVPPPATYPLILASGEKRDIPGICFGTGLPESSIENSYINTKMAFDMGYKLVDTAVMYGNEKEIGEAVKTCKWVRRSVTVVTKFEYSKLKGEDIFAETVAEIQGSLERLDTKYIDVLLLHDTSEVPLEDLTDVWKAMESMTDKGHVRAIGLSNAMMQHIVHVNEIATVPISMVQNLFTPFYYDKDVYNYCLESKIPFMAFGITGDYFVKIGFKVNPSTSHPLIRHLAELYDTSPHAVLSNWAAQKRVIVISRSSQLQHMKENLDYRDLYLNMDHIKQIDDLFGTIKLLDEDMNQE